MVDGVARICTYRFEQDSNCARLEGVDKKDRAVGINNGLSRRNVMAQLMAG